MIQHELEGIDHMPDRISINLGTAKFITRAMAILGGMAAIIIALILQVVVVAGVGVAGISTISGLPVFSCHACNHKSLSNK